MSATQTFLFGWHAKHVSTPHPQNHTPHVSCQWVVHFFSFFGIFSRDRTKEGLIDSRSRGHTAAAGCQLAVGWASTTRCSAIATPRLLLHTHTHTHRRVREDWEEAENYTNNVCHFDHNIVIFPRISQLCHWPRILPLLINLINSSRGIKKGKSTILASFKKAIQCF